MKSVVVVFCLLAVSASAFLSTSGSAAFINRLEDINASAYGKDLLDTIALQLKSNAPVDTIISLLDNLATDLTTQQQNADAQNAKDVADCEAAIAEFNRRINVANFNIEDSSNILATERPHLEQTKNEIANKVQEIERNSKDLAAGKANRNRDAAAYEARRADHFAALEALEEAQKRIGELVGSVAGKGIEGSSTRISAEKAVNALLQMSDSSAIAVMAELAATADQDTVNKIIALLQNLIDSLHKSLVDDAEDEKKFASEWAALESELSKADIDLRAARDSLLSKQQTLEGIIAQQEKRLAENKAELESATDALNAKTEDCESKAAYYESSSNKRAEEQSIIKEVRDIFTSQLSTMKSYLKDRVENVA